MRSCWIGLLCAATLGCAAPSPDGVAATVARRVGASPYVLQVSPAVPGEVMTLTVSGLPPGTTTFFLVSTRGEGPGPCHPNLPVCVDVNAPATVLGSARADASGVATRQVTVPATLRPGIGIWVQGAALLGAASDTTQVVHRLLGDGDADGVLPGDDCDDTDATRARYPDCDPLVALPPGVFDMGCVEGRDDGTFACDPAELPVHPVRLTRPFEVSRSEVTQAQWAATLGVNPSAFSTSGAHGVDCGPDCPVESVTWWDALAFANAVSAAHGLPSCYTLSNCAGVPGDGLFCAGQPVVNAPGGDPGRCEGYRLPTEAEWEYAARGREAHAFPGSDTRTDVAWTSAETSQPRPVCTKVANAFDLCDMSGNVTEWTWDRHGAYSASPALDPTGSTTGAERSVRGGDFGSTAATHRTAARGHAYATFEADWLGVRLARTLPDADADGLSDADEARLGTDPALADSDGDGLPDGAEVHDLGTDPLAEDTDGDGLGDADEVAWGLSPTVSWRVGCASEDETPASSLDACLPTVDVPSGTFEMGCLSDRDATFSALCARYPITGPAHTVALTRPFEMTTSEVTRRAWTALMGAEPSAAAPGTSAPCTGDCPVDRVSYWDALAFANAASHVAGRPACYDLAACTGTPGVDLTCPGTVPVLAPAGDVQACEGYRLPTEAEWEYAARADGDLRFPGSHIAADVAWYAADGPAPVCTLDANAWGLCDLAGNLLEWTWDGHWPYGDFLDVAATSVDPIGPPTATPVRTVRGGAYTDGDSDPLHSAWRGAAPLPDHYRTIGLRLVRTVPDTDGDRLSDAAEQRLGTDPLDPDTDGDGVLDGTEHFTTGTDPLDPDTDGDGLDDGLEVLNGTDPLTPFATQCVPGQVNIGSDQMVCVPAGTVSMGCDPARDGQPGCAVDETPLHDVTLTRAVWVAPRETTVGLWDALVGDGRTDPACVAGPQGCLVPVSGLTWSEAVVLANLFSVYWHLPTCYDVDQCVGTMGAGLDCGVVDVRTPSGSPYDCDGYRLPTEAEWEHFARADTSQRYAGSDVAADVAWTVENSAGGPSVTCGLARNAFGLCDLSGNVAEWTGDLYGPYGAGPDIDPVGAPSAPWRVVRGGSYDLPTSWARVAHRRAESPDEPIIDLGVRFVRTFQPDRDGDGLDDGLERGLGRDPLRAGE